MNPSRRGLFGLFAGAAAAPALPRPPHVVFSEPTRPVTWTRYAGYDIRMDGAIRPDGFENNQG